MERRMSILMLVMILANMWSLFSGCSGIKQWKSEQNSNAPECIKLHPGMIYTMKANSVVCVPSGTIIENLNGSKVMLEGKSSYNTIHAQPGAVIRVSEHAKGEANNYVTTMKEPE